MTAPVLLTMGDPAGIGPEIIIKALAQAPNPSVVVVGDVGVMQTAAQRLVSQGHAAGRVRAIQAHQMNEPVAPGELAVLQVGPPLGEVALGQVSAAAGRASADAVTWAAQAALRGQACGVVTAPIHKQAWHAAGVPFPGHTEMLQALSAQHLGCEVSDLPVRMMLATPRLRVVLVTIHLALRQAIEAIDQDLVFETLRIAHDDLQRMLGRAPRLAVAGLNPHAGEGGQMGDEEGRILAPAIEAAQREGWQVSGPLPSDTVFLSALDPTDDNQQFDAVVAMYHDQGLIPIKLMGFDEGVNVTLGLPLRRTSPDHGTAFDLAGQGRARPDSLLAALADLQLAVRTPLN
jgi:4-hydroxythreonine-4-phosphate dehydrogenase